MRRVIAALVVVGLAVGVVLLWPGSTTEEPPATSAGPTTTASSPTSVAPTSTTAPTTTTSTTTASGSHVVETVEEAEEILREFLTKWFTAIAQEDEEALRSLVGNPRQIEAGLEQFGVMEFTEQPTREAVLVENIELLRSDEDCLVIWSESGGEFRGGTSPAVHTFRWHDGTWLFINTWLFKEDLWDTDCESIVEQ